MDWPSVSAYLVINLKSSAIQPSPHPPRCFGFTSLEGFRHDTPPLDRSGPSPDAAKLATEVIYASSRSIRRRLKGTSKVQDSTKDVRRGAEGAEGEI